jgi:hypothetical protein
MILQSVRPMAGEQISPSDVRTYLATVDGGNAMVRAKLH